jgi:hypothetical protein
MTLQQFINKYDVPNAIVLLEGKRVVLESDQPLLTALGKLLAEKTQHIIFRSGNARGADEFFCKGVAAVNNQRLQAITPYTNHRNKENKAFQTIALDTINLAEEPAIIEATKTNKKASGLADAYMKGYKGVVAQKAALLLRDTIKVTGTKDLPPATFAIFYDDLLNPNTGGTGHTMDVCKFKNVPYIDQQVWMNWL